MGDLTANFSLSEYTRSSTAERYGIDNTPGAAHRRNILAHATYVLQPLRDMLQRPISITSGYRSAALNDHPDVGGVATSFHSKGMAADINAEDMSAGELALFVRDSGLPYDELILEYGAHGEEWVHIAFDPGRAEHVFEQWTYYDAHSVFETKVAGIIPRGGVIASSSKALTVIAVLVAAAALAKG